MKISKMANAVEPSLTRKLFNKAKEYDDVIDLTLGDPDLVPPENIRSAACRAIMDGKTKYSANAGLPELRNAIADTMKREYSISVDPTAEIVVTVGGMEGLYLALSTIIDDGDEVIIPAPYYVNYVQMVKMCGGIPVIVDTEEDSGFSVKPQDILAKITPKTVAIIVNTPCNPTGEVLSGTILDGIAKIAVEHNLVVIADEVYRTLIYVNKKHESIITRPGMKERTILIDSLSKRYSMTGYRLGFTVAPAELIVNMTKMQENLVACAPLPSQYAAIEAYGNNSDYHYIVDEFSKRRNYLADAINDMGIIYCRKPAATFYLFVNISKTGLKSEEFAYKLLESVQVAVVPGIAYGKKYDNYIRIAFTLEVPRLMKAVERIKKFLGEIK